MPHLAEKKATWDNYQVSLKK